MRSLVQFQPLTNAMDNMWKAKADRIWRARAIILAPGVETGFSKNKWGSGFESKTEYVEEFRSNPINSMSSKSAPVTRS
jgi:hypothetical protein